MLGCCAALALVAIAPAGASATVTPGVQTVTEGAQCTANFIFRDGGETYVGQAAHCSGTGAATDTDGCDSGSLPIGTPVEVSGATQPGTLVYNSWITMQQSGESNADVCAYNDLALVKLEPADAAAVEPVGARLRRADGARRPAEQPRRDRVTRTATPRCAAA